MTSGLNTSQECQPIFKMIFLLMWMEKLNVLKCKLLKWN